MLLYFAGAEVTSHFAILRECGVERVAVSAANLNRVVKGPAVATWASQDRLGGLEWVLYADSVHTPVSAITTVLSGAEVQPEAVTGPPEWYETSWLKDSDLQFLPTWDGSDPALLRQYTEDFDGVMLPDAAVDNPVHVRAARAALPRLGVLGALTGRTKGLERFDILCSSAWWAVQKHGETQVWTGDRLVRLNNEDKLLKRQRYADAIDALGVDVDAIMADDPNETLRLAVKSWLKLEAHIQAGRTIPVPVAVPNDPSEVARQHHPTSTGTVVPISSGVARPTPQTRHHMLPVMGLKQTQTVVKDAAGNDVTETTETLEVNAGSMRQCNTCSLSVGCPQFTPHSACSYEIPVMVRNKTELNGVLRALVEMQTQRILQGRFTEEINGQADVLLGREMDRLFQMVERWRNIEDNRDSLKITVDSKGDAQAGMGVLSRLFGEKAGQNALRLEHPLDVEEVIEQMGADDDD